MGQSFKPLAPPIAMAPILQKTNGLGKTISEPFQPTKNLIEKEQHLEIGNMPSKAGFNTGSAPFQVP